MFTGIIEEIGYIKRIKRSADGAELEIAAETILSDLKEGDSVAVSGPCLTATANGGKSFKAWVMPETLSKTTIGELASGSPVNLERALAIGGRLGGHIVSGHIDAKIILINRRLEGGAVIFTFQIPEELQRYIVPKGSVALDGVSLTVIDTGRSDFSVGIIPHTAAGTTFGHLEPGGQVNLEVDLIGKYVEKMLQPREEGQSDKKDTLTMNLLQEKGFLTY